MNNPTITAISLTTFFKAQPISIPVKNPPPSVAAREVFSKAMLYLKTTVLYYNRVYSVVKKYTTLFGKKELDFIKRLQTNESVRGLYKPTDIRQLKYRLLYKRKVLTNDLIVLNSILDKLQSL